MPDTQPERQSLRQLIRQRRKSLSQAEQQALMLAQLHPVIGEPAKSLDLVSPYFVPTQAGVDAFAHMRKQGVRVRILTNSLEATDVAAVHAGYESYRKPLLELGVELYEMRRQINLRPHAPAPVASPASSAQGATPSPAAFSGSKGGLTGSSGASLHAKTFAVDGQRLFVGSFNFDPRSALLNTEQGLVIKHPGMASEVTQSLNQYLPMLAYQVQLDDKGKLRWSAETPEQPGQTQSFSQDPGTSWFKRAMVRVLSWLPIEGLL